MRFLLYLLIIVITSCSTFSKEREQQSKIDSLTAELRLRENEARQENQISKVERAPDTTMIEKVNEPLVSESGKLRKKAETVSEKHEEVQTNEDSNKEEKENETGKFEDERNAVLKRVFVDKPTFKPFIFGGFKDIKFNLINNYD